MTTNPSRSADLVSVGGIELLADDPRERYRQKLARITLDSMGQFVVLLDANGTVLEINQAALDAVGIKFSDVEGKPFWTTFWWQVSEEINATLREMIRRASRGELVRWDTPIYGRAGGEETVIIDASLTPVRDEQGDVVYITAEGRDITEKKAYEREVARLREELAKRDDLKTRSFASAGRGERRASRSDGTLGSTGARAVPIVDQRGDIIEWFGAASDAGLRMQVEAERERLAAESDRQRRIYEAALSNTPDLVYVFDLEHRFIYANEALLKMWGRTRDDALGKTCLQLGYEPWHAEMHDREIEQVVATRKPFRGEVPFTGTNGRRIYDYIFVPVIGRDGQVVAVAGTTRDVTERQQAEQEIRAQAERLRENDRRKDEFLAMLAHELRNPLAAISNAAEVTTRSDSLEHREWSQEVIRAQVKNLSRMIDDLLDVSRITRGKIQLRRQHLKLAPIINSAVESARPLMEERKHRFILDLATEPLPVQGDPTRLEQIVVNLLNNAAKYTESNGRITLTARREGRVAVIAVEDTGVGMSPELLARAFDLFAQGDRTIARSEGGLGIGLTLVKSLVEMHGGRVTAESEGLGKGSRFTVRLPLAQERARGGEHEEHPAAETKRKGSKVLVVDDSVDTAYGMARLLKLLGHDVRMAHDGPSAIEEARSHRPDIILLDLGLPGMDGYEVARTLRDEGFERAVIIAVSGYGEQQALARSRESGFNHHLIKPVDLDSLVALIDRPR